MENSTKSAALWQKGAGLRFTDDDRIQERFRQTDQALEEVPTWPNVGAHYVTRLYDFAQIDASLTKSKQPMIDVVDAGRAFKSKLKFQIQHEVFR